LKVMFWFDDVNSSNHHRRSCAVDYFQETRRILHPPPCFCPLPFIHSYWQIPFASSTSLNPLSSKQKKKKKLAMWRKAGAIAPRKLSRLWLWLVSFAHAFMHVEHATK
jgi:hypothetical protein